MTKNTLQNLAKLIRYYILKMSTTAGSGHPTSSLSATDLMTVLFFGGPFHFDFAHPDNLANDRLIFSKGHATPLFYALYAAAGAIKPEELETYRQFDSRLEGHATMRFPFAEAATGSLGQGLSVGVGIALALRHLRGVLPLTPREWQAEVKAKATTPPMVKRTEMPHVFVLLGDGELAEGAVWEAINLASYYKLDNLVAIVDVNRLGQSQETMLGWDVKTHQKRFEAFGWRTVVIDGHNYSEIVKAFASQRETSGVAVSLKTTPGVTLRGSPGVKGSVKPLAIIAKTVKGQGISFLENKENWHGKPLSQEQFEQAVAELGRVDFKLKGKVEKPARICHSDPELVEGEESLAYARKMSFRQAERSLDPASGGARDDKMLPYKLGDSIPTRKAYGTALARLGEVYPQIVSLDGDVKNSTYSEIFKEKYPDRFFEMFIAEQNMTGAAAGLSKLGFIPFVSTFAAFLTRAFDQIRMSAIGGANIKFCGSHAGVSIGEDGPSQMGLEDIAMFRSIHNSVVLYPSDALSCEKLVEEMIKHQGISYLRTTRPPTPVIYDNKEQFPIGGCKIHRLSPKSLKLLKSLKQKVIIIAAGITLFEALKAQEVLGKQGIEAIVVDCYSIKPIDEVTLKSLIYSSSDPDVTSGESRSSRQARTIVITVEDHYFDGGLGDAVLNVFAGDRKVKVHKLAVCKMPRSGKPQQLLDFEGISASAIVKQLGTGVRESLFIA